MHNICYDQKVVFYLVGFATPIPLDVEMLRRERELSSAQRVLLRVVESYDRFFEVVLADALFFSVFFNSCVSLGK